MSGLGTSKSTIPKSDMLRIHAHMKNVKKNRKCFFSAQELHFGPLIPRLYLRSSHATHLILRRKIYSKSAPKRPLSSVLKSASLHSDGYLSIYFAEYGQQQHKYENLQALEHVVDFKNEITRNT